MSVRSVHRNTKKIHQKYFRSIIKITRNRYPSLLNFFFNRDKLQKPLNFDNYKDRFRLLLQLEEIQMQKDIRHYDMKEVEFEQDRTDRRFLTLEVSTHLNCSWLEYVCLRFYPALPPCCIPSFYILRSISPFQGDMLLIFYIGKGILLYQK